MTKTVLLSACIAAVALSLVGCGPSRNEKITTVEASEAQRRIDELEKLLADCESRDAGVKLHEGTAKGKDSSDVDRDTVGKNAAISHRDHADEVVITVENAILFRPGKSELSAQAKATLARVATLLNEKYAGDEVRVEGFTDNQQITRSKNEWDDNFDLAGGRARAVLHYLAERGVSIKRLGFAGYADNKSVASNNTEAGRAKNRRVEIVVLPSSGRKSKSND